MPKIFLQVDFINQNFIKYLFYVILINIRFQDFNNYIYQSLFSIKHMDKVSSFFGGLSGSVDIDIILDKKQKPKIFKYRTKKGERIKLPVYEGNDDISGVVQLNLKDTKKYEHLGVKMSLIGYLQIYSDKNLCTQFHASSKQLEPAGILTESKTCKFKFPNFEKQYQTFNGIAGRVRYFLRCTVTRNLKTTLTKQVDFAVLLPNDAVQKTDITPMRMEVGIEDCLHIDFEWDKSFYHLKDVIVGKVSFHLVKIKIRSMQISLVRKQTFGTGTKNTTQTQTLVKYEVMDGCPDRGEVIPIRMYMNGIELAPSYDNIHNRLSVKYWINLVLMDEQDRRYFKQTQITIYRKP